MTLPPWAHNAQAARAQNPARFRARAEIRARIRFVARKIPCLFVLTFSRVSLGKYLSVVLGAAQARTWDRGGGRLRRALA